MGMLLSKENSYYIISTNKSMGMLLSKENSPGHLRVSGTFKMRSEDRKKCW
jgi:hypothetical protein